MSYKTIGNRIKKLEKNITIGNGASMSETNALDEVLFDRQEKSYLKLLMRKHKDSIAKYAKELKIKLT